MARRLADWIASYNLYTAYSEAPDEYHFWTAISTLAGALRRKVYFDEKIFKWSPNFYIIFVAPPGIAKKSSTIDLGYQMLREIPSVVLGPSSMTWQTIPKLLASARVDWDISPPGNGLLDAQLFPMSCVSFGVGELGTLIQFEDKQLIDLLVDLWDGKTHYDKMTKTQGDDLVVNPWINIIAGVTPSWLDANLSRVLVGGGFVSRCVFVYKNSSRHDVAYPTDFMDNSFDALRADLVHDLEEISQLHGQYFLTPEARQWGREWYSRIKRDLLRLSSDTSANFRARVQGHVHKLAMVLSASRSDALAIEVGTLKEAAVIVEEVEKDLKPIFRTLDALPEMATAEEVYDFVEKFGRVSKMVLYSKYIQRFHYKDEFEKAISSGIAAGKLTQEQQGSTIFLRWSGDEPMEGEEKKDERTPEEQTPARGGEK